jgi:drug/metabolite transporter (DMT)-like permease
VLVWVSIAAIGGLLSIAGLAVYVRRFRRGEITLRYLLAVVVGYASFVSFALVGALRPESADAPWAVGILLPGFVAVVVLVRERGRTGMKDTG